MSCKGILYTIMSFSFSTEFDQEFPIVSPAILGHSEPAHAKTLPVKPVPIPITQFNIGDIACIKEKAIRGFLEKVCIKKTRQQGIHKLYEDTFNGLWDDWELVTENVATNLIYTSQCQPCHPCYSP